MTKSIGVVEPEMTTKSGEEIGTETTWKLFLVQTSVSFLFLFFIPDEFLCTVEPLLTVNNSFAVQNLFFNFLLTYFVHLACRYMD